VKAVVQDRYGPPDVLRIEDVPKPVPSPDEILIRIRATGVTRSDAHLRAGEPLVSRFQSGLRRPKRKILGHELAGEVEAVGRAVTEFEVGARVFGALPYLALSTGAHAEYMSVPERFPLAHMPAGMSFEEAGAVGDGALLTLSSSGPRAGSRASGPSSTVRPARSGRQEFSWRSTSAPESPPCATRRTSSSFAR